VSYDVIGITLGPSSCSFNDFFRLSLDGQKQSRGYSDSKVTLVYLCKNRVIKMANDLFVTSNFNEVVIGYTPYQKYLRAGGKKIAATLFVIN